MLLCCVTSFAALLAFPLAPSPFPAVLGCEAKGCAFATCCAAPPRFAFVWLCRLSNPAGPKNSNNEPVVLRRLTADIAQQCGMQVMAFGASPAHLRQSVDLACLDDLCHRDPGPANTHGV